MNSEWSSDGRVGPSSPVTEISVQKNRNRTRPPLWWLDEDGLFNLDDEGRAENQQCAVAASNIIRNFSFMPENEVIMAQHRHLLEMVFQCVEDHITGDMLCCFVRILLCFFFRFLCFNRSSHGVFNILRVMFSFNFVYMMWILDALE